MSQNTKPPLRIASYDILLTKKEQQLDKIEQSSCLHCASMVSKTPLIIPTDAHNYKIIGILKQLKFRQLLRHVSVHAGTIIRELFRA
jgi:hypothetical protein